MGRRDHRGPRRPVRDFGYRNIPVASFVQPPLKTYDYPNPRGPMFPIVLRTIALPYPTMLPPTVGTVALYLGLTAEGQNDFRAARAAYASYVKYGRTTRVRYALESRLASLQRKELLETARAEVQNERQLAGVPGAPNVVAVLPLSFSGADTTLRPLGRGLAELLTTDLARSSRLTVVERLRLQALILEIARQAGAAHLGGHDHRAIEDGR